MSVHVAKSDTAVGAEDEPLPTRRLRNALKAIRKLKSQHRRGSVDFQLAVEIEQTIIEELEFCDAVDEISARLSEGLKEYTMNDNIDSVKTFIDLGCSRLASFREAIRGKRLKE